MATIELDLDDDQTTRIAQLTAAILTLVERCLPVDSVDPGELALACFSAATTRMVDSFGAAAAARHHDLMARYCWRAAHARPLLLN